MLQIDANCNLSQIKTQRYQKFDEFAHTYVPILPRVRSMLLETSMIWWLSFATKAGISWQRTSRSHGRRRTGKLYRARSRLYRSRSLQANTHLTALAEIYKMHSFYTDLKSYVCQQIARILPKQNAKMFRNLYFVKFAELTFIKTLVNFLLQRCAKECIV